jgi:hypothetical protein
MKPVLIIVAAWLIIRVLRPRPRRRRPAIVTLAVTE